MVPVIAEEYRVESSSSSNCYTVSLSGQQCDCPDWWGRRKGFAVGNPSRCCKHLARAYFRHHAGRLSPWLASIFRLNLDRDKGVDLAPVWMLANVAGKPTAIGIGPAEDWVNVYSIGLGGALERFGYNTNERRWSYEMAPGESEAIEQFIEAVKLQT